MCNKTAYKVGDEVVIVSERTPYFNTEGGMDKFLGEIMTVGAVCNDSYKYTMVEDEGFWRWDDEMIDHDKTLFRTKRDELYETSLRTMSRQRESYQKDVGMEIYKIDELEEDTEYTNEKYSNLTFKIVDGTLWQSTQKNHWKESRIDYNTINRLEFTELDTIEYNPSYGGIYWHPQFRNDLGVSKQVWSDSEVDIRTEDLVGVFRTMEQAREKAKELGWL